MDLKEAIETLNKLRETPIGRTFGPEFEEVVAAAERYLRMRMYFPRLIGIRHDEKGFYANPLSECRWDTFDEAFDALYPPQEDNEKTTEDRSMKRIFIAGPISGKEIDYIQNVANLLQAGAKLWKAGFSPFVPSLDFLLGLFADSPTVEEYKRVSLDFLEVCDAVVYIGISPGVEAEIARAVELGIPVYSYSAFCEVYGVTM